MERETVLISGGTGLIGKRLSSLLLSQGFNIAILSRHTSVTNNDIRSFFWDPERNIIDPEALLNASYIVHLAGENIGAARWSRERKNSILSSRVESGRLLYNEFLKHNRKPKAFITASGVNYYGTVTVPKIFRETDPPAHDFLGRVCREWEQTAIDFESAGIRSVIIRSGIALSMEGGVLPRLAGLASKGLGAAVGSGEQFIPWVHLEDLCSIYLKAINNTEMHGAYNAVAPEHSTNRNFMRTLSSVYHKPFILPAVPSLALKLAYGEMASLVLEGSRVSSEKLIRSGFAFRFRNLECALSDLCRI
jgi:uncharacterized protein (TIGR01777 family)